MKYVIGIVPVGLLEEVTRALGRGGIYRLTVGEVDAVATGKTAAPGPQDRRLRLEVAVNDEFLEPALEAFRAVQVSDDRVWVSVLPLEETLRIRTGETGHEAI
ncbi:MAG: P-II family nitrogen regulator [Planctomycetota bacterium]